MSDFGEVAYTAYSQVSGGVSLASGQPLPAWVLVAPRVQAAWRVAAAAVLLESQMEAAQNGDRHGDPV